MAQPIDLLTWLSS